MKKAFTLIEIILAIMILSILILALNHIIVNLKTTKEVLESVFDKEKENELFIKTLYYDFLNATNIKVKHSKTSDYDRIYLQTQNSLYDLTYPYVVWYVSKKDNTLIRIESPFKIKLPSYEAFFLDKFVNNVEIFRVFRKNGKDLIFIKAKKPIYFEIIDKDYGIVQKNNKKTSKENNKSTINSSTPQSAMQPSFLPTF